MVNLSGNQMKDLHAIDNLIWERRPIRSDDWGIVLSGFTRRKLPCRIPLVITGAFGWVLPRRIYWLVGPSRLHQRPYDSCSSRCDRSFGKEISTCYHDCALAPRLLFTSHLSLLTSHFYYRPVRTPAE